MAVCVLNRLHMYLLGFDVKHDIKPVFWIKDVEYQGFFSTLQSSRSHHWQIQYADCLCVAKKF